jgi:hypothetical protein
MDEVKDPKKVGLSDTESRVLKVIFVIGLIYATVSIFGIKLLSDDIKSYLSENGETILSLSVLLLSLLILFSIFGIKMVDDGEKNKKLKKEVTIETFGTNYIETFDTNTDNDVVNDNDVVKTFSKIENANFCNSEMSSDEKNDSCKKLTKDNCTTVGCCVLLNGEKCVGGNESGPTYLTENGKDIDVQYYKYKDTCKGKACPST